MNIDNIISNHERLDRELKIALSTMERSDRVFEIKKEIIENQKQCPHLVYPCASSSSNELLDGS